MAKPERFLIPARNSDGSQKTVAEMTEEIADAFGLPPEPEAELASGDGMVVIDDSDAAPEYPITINANSADAELSAASIAWIESLESSQAVWAAKMVAERGERYVNENLEMLKSQSEYIDSL